MKTVATFLSYIFHPLFIPLYFFLWVLYRFPLEFATITPSDIIQRIVGVSITTILFPAVTVLLLWKLKFVSSIYLNSSKERIVPYIACMIFYWWMWYLSRGFNDQASILKVFYFGIFIATIPALILNSFLKVSMHAIGMLGLWTATILTVFTYQFYLGLDIIIVTLLSGFVLSARLYLKQHTLAEIFLGGIIGCFAQLIAYWTMS